ncbi:MAG: hypothetical protein ACYDGY_10995 [Acidimicrobiales bacterium]
MTGSHQLPVDVAFDSHTGALRFLMLTILPSSTHAAPAHGSTASTQTSASIGAIPEEVTIAILPSTGPAVVSLPPSSQVLYLGQHQPPSS